MDQHTPMPENNLARLSLARWLQIVLALCGVAVAGAVVYALVVRPEVDRRRYLACVAVDIDRRVATNDTELRMLRLLEHPEMKTAAQEYCRSLYPLR